MSKITVKNGAIIIVPNKNPVFGANDTYISIWVEDLDGKNERAIFLTEREFEKLPSVDLWVKKDMVVGRLYPVKLNNKSVYFVKGFDSKVEYVFILTEKKLKAFENRAKKNKEDIPKKSFWADLRD